MAKYTLKKGEDIDKVLKRFRRKLKQDGVINDMRKHEYYEKPSDKRKREESVAKRKTFLQSLDE